MLATIAMALGALIGGDPADEVLPDPFANLPEGWTVEATLKVTAEQAAAIGKKLGGDVVGLSNTTLSVDGEPLKVNLIHCRSDADVLRVYQSLLKIKGSPQLVLVQGKSLVEFVARDIRLPMRAHYELGFKPRRVAYRVSFAAAPLVKCDYMQWNRLFNAFLAVDQMTGSDRPKAEATVAERSKAFTFDDALRLRSMGQCATPIAWTFDPQPRDDLDDGGVNDGAGAGNDDDAKGSVPTSRFQFDRLPAKAGVPYVRVTGDIVSEAFARIPDAGADAESLIATTQFWPVDDKEVASLAKKITAGCVTPRQKVEAILDWLLPGKNIRYAGDVTGSRYGVSQVLKQGFGHCWDFSDVCITLCRAVGVPARQVGGWLVGQSGHVWVEALTDDDGWEAFDPTAGMGCGSDYVPIITTADGQWPLVYASAVEIEAIEGR